METIKQLNQIYLSEIADCLKKQGIIECQNDFRDSLNTLLYEHFKSYRIIRGRKPSGENDSYKEYKYENFSNGVNISVILKRPKEKLRDDEMLLYCNGKESHLPPLSKDGYSYLREEIKTETKHDEEYNYLISFMLYDIFSLHNIQLPRLKAKPFSDLSYFEDFYAVITSADSPKTNIIEDTDSWNDIYNSQTKLLYYLFDIIENETLDAKIFSQKVFIWNNILPGKRYTKDDLYKYSQKMIDNFYAHPMYEYLFEHNTKKHMNEVREILRHMSGKNNVLHSPVISILEWVNEIASEVSRNSRLFFALDFLHIIGFLADRIKKNTRDSKHNANHLLYENELTDAKEFYLSTHSNLFKNKTEAKRVFDGVVKSFKQSELCDNLTFDGVKFKIKPFRLVCAGIYNAFSINRSDTLDNAIKMTIDSIEEYFPEAAKSSFSESENDVKLEKEFHEKFDDYCFYGLGMLYNLDSSLLEKVINEFCNKASDFSSRPRQRQICYIYLLSAILASDLRLSKKCIEQILYCTYAKTMYSFQISYWNYMTSKYPVFFEEYVEKSVKDSCTINNNFAKGQPLFYFAYGLAHQNEDVDINTPIGFLINCTQVQAKSWKAIQKDENTAEIIGKIKELFYEAYNMFFVRQKKSTFTKTEKPDKLKAFTSETMYYVYGVQMLSYALANIYNYCTSIKKKIDADIYKISLVSDYYMRKYNKKYPKNISQGYLLCGSYRLSNVEEVKLSHIANAFDFTNQDTMREDYKNWLTAEYEAQNYRYLYLMCRLLKRTNFAETFNKNEKWISNITTTFEKNREKNDFKFTSRFLSYDHFSYDNLF